VFVDASGFYTSMKRLYARAPRGRRAYGKVPRNRGKNTTLIAAVTPEGGMGESVAIEGATDASAFEAYVEHFLAPTLEEGQVVVLDGLGAHRTGKVRELIESTGADLLFLPSRSPDPNPIGEAFSKMKQLVRKAGARTRQALVEAVARALAAVTLGDVAGWFAHAGYQAQDQSLSTAVRTPAVESTHFPPTLYELTTPRRYASGPWWAGSPRSSWRWSSG